MDTFIDKAKDVLSEQGKTTADLFENNVVCKNTFYKYAVRQPSLPTLIKIANFLRVSIDYLYGLSDENNFKKYSSAQNCFYDKLITMIESAKISCRKFCKELNYSRDNVARWRGGTMPSVQTLLDCAKYFHCNIDEFLEFE